MRNTAATHRDFFLTARQRALLTAALLALGPVAIPVRAQLDLATAQARAAQGDPEALNALGNAYTNGQGVAPDIAQAIRYYQQAADKGLTNVTIE